MPGVSPQGKVSQIVWTLPMAIRVAHTITSRESNVTACAVLVQLRRVSGLDPTGDRSCDATVYFILMLPYGLVLCSSSETLSLCASMQAVMSLLHSLAQTRMFGLLQFSSGVTQGRL